MSTRWSGFQEMDVDVRRGRLHTRCGGAGLPVLLLHGYPQTHEMWHEQASALAQQYRVVVPDLRGYGDSVSTSDDFSFRALADDMVELMAGLGHPRFHVIGHDRGARASHRMALDHTDAVLSVALLDILPTLEVWRQMNAELGLRYFHWLFLAQGGGLPQKLINGDPVAFLGHALDGLGGGALTFAPEARAAYERAAMRPRVVDAWCRDYAAGASVDREHDVADEGVSLDVPALILWGDRGAVPLFCDPLEVWRTRFPGATGHGLPAGHFLAEECPEATTRALQEHLAAVAAGK